MKKFFLYSFALICSLIMSTHSAAAQELVLPVQIPELNPKVLETAKPALDLMLTNPDKATNIINKAIKLTKNEKGQMMALANWLMEQEGGIQGARYVIEKLYQNNAEDIDVLLLAGDIYGTMGQWGRAGQKYDQVLGLDAENIYAITQGARIYKNHNPDASLALWEKLQTLQPDNVLAMRNIGDLLYDKNYMGEALENYSKYFDATPHTKDAISAASMERYLIGLFFAEGQEKRLTEVATSLCKVDPENLVYNRFAFIGSMLTYDSVPATLERIKGYSKYITSGKTPDSLLIYQDYFYAYQMSEADGQLDDCVRFLTKAVEKDASQVSLLKSGAINMNANGHHEQAAELYAAYCDRAGADVTFEDLMNVVVLYRQGATASQDPSEKLALKDKAFAALDKCNAAAKDEEKYQIPLERARVLNVMAEKDAAQVAAYYEEAINTCTDVDKAGNNLYDAAFTLMIHQANSMQTTTDEDKTLADMRKYCNMVLNIDPFNEGALEIDEILRSLNK